MKPVLISMAAKNKMQKGRENIMKIKLLGRASVLCLVPLKLILNHPIFFCLSGKITVKVKITKQ